MQLGTLAAVMHSHSLYTLLTREERRSRQWPADDVAASVQGRQNLMRWHGGCFVAALWRHAAQQLGTALPCMLHARHMPCPCSASFHWVPAARWQLSRHAAASAQLAGAAAGRPLATRQRGAEAAVRRRPELTLATRLAKAQRNGCETSRRSGAASSHWRDAPAAQAARSLSDGEAARGVL